jgi:anti-anti-sigma regulatory factor
MPDRASLGPLTLESTGNRLLFRLDGAYDPALDLPPEYDRFLAQELDGISAEPIDAELNLDGCPAISSRQLGAMLALQKALRPRSTRLKLTGVGPRVRELLETSRTIQFFEVR